MMSNFSCSAITLMTRFACSTTCASSSLRRWFRSSRNSRCLRWNSRLMSPNSRSFARRAFSPIVTEFLSRSSCMRLSCSAILASSWSRFWNSASIFFCARTAGAASRRMRSVLTKPNLPVPVAGVWAAAGSVATARAAARARRARRVIRSSESGTERELYPLDVIAVLLVDRLREGDAQGAEGRQPRQAQAACVAQLGEFHFLPLAPHLAGVDERGQLERRIGGRAGHREGHLGRAGEAAVSADRVARQVPRPEREGAVAAHRIRTAREVGLEERQRLAAESPCVTEVTAQHQRESARQRGEPLVLVVEAVELQVSAGELA